VIRFGFSFVDMTVSLSQFLRPLSTISGELQTSNIQRSTSNFELEEPRGNAGNAAAKERRERKEEK
jgi:hypothetical protein